jgi:hypothetical protein
MRPVASKLPAVSFYTDFLLLLFLLQKNFRPSVEEILVKMFLFPRGEMCKYLLCLDT